MYIAKDFTGLIGLEGFSDNMLKNHFALYEGYVNNANLLNRQLSELSASSDLNGPEYNELKRRYGWEYNGMYLHELYFENMKNGGGSIDESSQLATEIEKQFGSFSKWQEEFITTGAMRGIGWALLVKTSQGELKNIWVNEHDVGFLVGSKPLIVMDVFEHSFMLDYGLKRMDYIKSFFASLDFNIGAKRYQE